MATPQTPFVPLGDGADAGDAAVQRHWRMAPRMSRLAENAERFLATAGFDRGPWLVVAFGGGIAAWFVLDTPWQWCAAIGLALLTAIAAMALWPRGEAPGGAGRAYLRQSLVALALMFAAGMAVVWLRSTMVGAPPITYPRAEILQGYVLEREEQPAEGRIRLTLATRDAETGVARKVRVNVEQTEATAAMAEGAVVRLRVRLMPPAPPMLPGSYNFARAAWFQGLAATGSAIGPIEVMRPALGESGLAGLQRQLSQHVRARLDGAPGSIAAAFASGDRGAISERDEDAMRDAGLTHLLSISGLHVSAVIGAAYIMALKLLALWPALALRVRLPLVAATTGALAGVGYTLLTGAEVPTVRSCVAALLVLAALALGREALSLRMVAVAGFAVLLLWPESLAGPSFQMSFAAVLVIVALHNSAPLRAFLAPREEGWLPWAARRGLMLVLTGVVIELALMPLVLFHFHRAGVYGALANVVAIPLVTFVTMPLIALALALDLAQLGAPVWWLVGQSLDLLLAIAHWTADQPGAVKLMPQMSGTALALFVAGGLWLALWQGQRRLWGFAPIGLATILLLTTPVPDLLVSGDGRHVGIVVPAEKGQPRRLVSLRESRSAYSRDNLLELAGVAAEPVLLSDWPGASCSADFCVVALERGGREWQLLLARNRVQVEERALAAACERADIVVADRWLPASCRPRWLKADRRFLERSGGLSVNLSERRIATVAEHQGDHGWWRAEAGG